MKRRRQFHGSMTQEEVLALWPRVLEGDADARRSIVEGHLTIILDWAEKVDGEMVSAAEAISKLSLAILLNMPRYCPTKMSFRHWLNQQKASLWGEIKRSAKKSEMKAKQHVAIKMADLPAPQISESALCCRVPTTSELALLLIPERDRNIFLRTLDLPMEGCSATMREIASDLGLTKARISQIVCLTRCLFRVYLQWIDCPRCHGRSMSGFSHHYDTVPAKHRDQVKKRIMRKRNLLLIHAFINRQGAFARAPFSLPKCC